MEIWGNKTKSKKLIVSLERFGGGSISKKESGMQSAVCNPSVSEGWKH